MHTDSSPQQVVRFELVVSGHDYRALVAGLRGLRSARASTGRPLKELRALVDLNSQSQTFSIAMVGGHKLPIPLHVRAGSPTHNSLRQAIARQVATQPLPSSLPEPLLEHLKEIIELCPEVTLNTLRAELADLELQPLDFNTPSGAVDLPILARIAPTLLLEFDEQPTLIFSDESVEHGVVTQDALRVAFNTCRPPTVRVSGNTATIRRSLTLPALPLSTYITFFSHWGSYEDLSPAWSDEVITTVQGSGRPQHISLRSSIHAPVHGWYGETIYASINGSSQRIWLGAPGSSDARFFIHTDAPSCITPHSGCTWAPHSEIAMRLQRALQDPAAVKESIEWLQQHAPQFPIGGELEAIAARGDDEAHAVQSLLDNLEKADYRELACQIKRTYGLGEIVFASPEFSHAGAGGLAQVLTGLPLELSKAGIPVTIITPLYRHYNGQRHPAADEILTNGLLVGNERVIPSYATTISVAVGPTRWSGSSWNKRPPATIRCKVFHAQSGQIRVLLLSSPGVFDRLYQPVSSDEQLRRAIIFSRAALETIASEQLAIRPRVVISNDWMTACIPAFLSLDPHYQRTPWLACCKSVHMIHNGGADYHGRLPLNVNREDLWPMFNLAPEHYFGFKDPHRDDLINLSMAAVRHAQGGVITVSQPYAEQLVSHHSGGDGLEHVLRHRSSDVAGISNGIKREELETFLATRTGLNFDELCCTTTLLQAKTSLRRDLQNRYGLVPSDSAFLISFVARLAEQKGLELLSGYVGDGARSALEDILIRHPNVQIIIAGPTTPGDRSASNLRECVHHLAACYPGRVAALCDYIAHSTALEIISASSLFLMPSRFEPGGISQLEALAVGTPVIGRNVGGIKATIDSFNPGDGRGTGFLFNEYSADAFVNTAHWAIETCSHASVFSSIVSQARLAQHSWSDRAPTFAATLQKIVLGEQRFYSLPFLSSARTLFDRARVPSSHDT